MMRVLANYDNDINRKILKKLLDKVNLQEVISIFQQSLLNEPDDEEEEEEENYGNEEKEQQVVN